MAKAMTSTARDPLRTYQFRIGIEDQRSSGGSSGGNKVTWVAGVRKVSGLTMAVSAFEVWEGGNNLHRYANPDKVTWEPISFEQGMALDDTLIKWAEAVAVFARDGKAGSVPVKRSVLLDVWDPRHHPSSSVLPHRTASYVIRNAWVSKYVALPTLDSMTSEVGLVTLELHHEGFFRRDLSTDLTNRSRPTT